MDERALRNLGGEGEGDATLVSTTGADPLIGALVADRYRVVRKIGEGGQASVYVAKHTLIKRLVALKALSPAMAADHELVQRFLDEGEVAGTMGHPNIVESLDMGVTDDGRPFLVLEYLEGTTVAAELGRIGALDVARACYIGSQIASALGAAHARGIVHRDLKPENVFLVERQDHGDHVKVLDFGISKIESRQGRAHDTLIVGTPEYMAAEQITSPATVDSRADVYALGAMLYEMLSGHAPLAVAAGENVLEVVVRRTPAPLGRVCPGLPPALIHAVERAMQKDRTRRTQTIDEVREVLEEFAVASPPVVPSKAPRVSGFKPISGTRTQRYVTPAPVPPLLTPAALPEPPPAKTTGPVPAPIAHRSITVPILAAVIGVAAGIIVLLFLRGGTKPDQVVAGAPLVAMAQSAEPAAPTVTAAPPQTGATSEPEIAPRASASIAPVIARPHVVYVAPPPPRPSASAAVVEKPAEKPVEKADCDPPFYFNERGKKVFKANCL